MISVYTYNIFTQGDLVERPYLMAMTLTLTVVSIVFGSIIFITNGKKISKGGINENIK